MNFSHLICWAWPLLRGCLVRTILKLSRAWFGGLRRSLYTNPELLLGVRRKC